MKTRDCYATIDMVYKDRERGTYFFVTKVIANFSDELVGYEITTKNGKAYSVTGEWLNQQIRSKRLEYIRTLSNNLGIEISAIHKTQTIYVIDNKEINS